MFLPFFLFFFTLFSIYFALASVFIKHLFLLVSILWHLCYVSPPLIVSSILLLFIFVVHLDLVCTLSVILFLVSSLLYIYIYIYIYTHTHTLPVPFYSFLSSVFCVLSFFIIVMLSFVTMCLCQFIWLFHCIILTFYCISLPSGLFCSNFSQFSLFLYPTWYKP